MIVAVVFFSCDKTVRKPEGILSHEEMVKILSEVYITEEKISRLALRPDSALQIFDLVKNRIYEKTGVPDSVFKKSVVYYLDHPKEMEMIYTVLVDSLHLKEQRVDYRPGQQ